MISRFAAVNLDHKSAIAGYQDIIKTLEDDDGKRIDFLMACLLKFGLDVNKGNTEVPSLSRLHLSSSVPSDISGFMQSLKEIISIENGEEYIRDEHDTFLLEKSSSWAFGSLRDALPTSGDNKADEANPFKNRAVDSEKMVLRVVLHDGARPAAKETPYFNHEAYYSNLKHYRSGGHDDEMPFGQCILYGDVVTSTNTILEK